MVAIQSALVNFFLTENQYERFDPANSLELSPTRFECFLGQSISESKETYEKETPDGLAEVICLSNSHEALLDDHRLYQASINEAGITFGLFQVGNVVESDYKVEGYFAVLKLEIECAISCCNRNKSPRLSSECRRRAL